MIEIKIEDKELRKGLEELVKKAIDRRPLMREIAGIMHHAVEQNFEQEGRPQWAPLAPATIRQRQKKGYWPGKILQMRGELAASISQRYTNDMAAVGTNKVYAGVHQFGFQGSVSVRSHTRRVKNKGIVTVREHTKAMNIPARPFLKLTDEDLELIKDKVLDYLAGK